VFGYGEGDLVIGDTIRLKLFHPNDGTAYASCFDDETEILKKVFNTPIIFKVQNTCENCKHWERVFGNSVGECKNITVYSDSYIDGRAEIYGDCGCGSKILQTHANFSCSLHEAK